MIPTLHPLADVARRWRSTRDGEEAEMTAMEAVESVNGPLPTRQSLWWEVRNYSSAMYLIGKTADAMVFAERALEMRRTTSTLHNMAVILEATGRFEEAIDYALEAVASDSEDDRATALLAESLLRMGRFAEGWPLYIRNRASMDWAKNFLPEWQGPHQDVDGKRILFIEGGGYGDNIYFLRWLHMLRHWGADVHYVCQPSFAPLVRRQGFRAIENWQGNADIDWRRYDYFCPLLSLGGKLGVTLANYKWRGPYIKAQRKPFFPTKCIGFCWRAGEGKSQRKQRTLHNEQRDRIIGAIPRTHTPVNLTYGYRHPDMSNPDMNDWNVTANIITQLDLVVSVDTGVLHLAGALDVPCLALLPGASAWQYPLYHTFHPLYPSMEILRNVGEGLDNAVESCAYQLENL